MPEIRKLETGKLLCLEANGSFRELDSLFARLEEFLQFRRVPHKGERLVILYDPELPPPADRAHFAAALELAGETTGDGEMTIVTQPAGWVACDTHRGPRAALADAYRKLQDWIRQEGFRVAGPAREYYLSSGPLGGETAEQAELEIELQLPVEKAEV